MAVMKDERLDKLSERDEIEALLPWYVSGKLDATSRARVERYMEANPEVKAHLALAREEAEASIAANEAISPPGRDALERLRASIAAAAPRREASAGLLTQLTDRFADWLAGFAPQQLALAGAVAALLVLLQAAVIGSFLMERAVAPTYQTAGGEETAGGGFELLVGFSPEATAGEITDLLRSLDAVVTDGPRAGLYRLRFPEAKESDEDRKAAIEALKQSGIVASVLPES
jgi:hypothetical protein